MSKLIFVIANYNLQLICPGAEDQNQMKTDFY